MTFFFLEETVAHPVPIAQLLHLKKEKVESTLPSADSRSEAYSPSTPPTKKAEPLVGDAPLPLRSLLTPRVVIAAGNYAFLSLVDIAFRAIQPLFYATPIELGGLGLPPPTIGKILAVFGILNGASQVLFFARIHDYWGPKKVFLAGVSSALPIFAAFPIISQLAKSQGLSGAVWAVVGFQLVISVMLSFSYGEAISVLSLVVLI